MRRRLGLLTALVLLTALAPAAGAQAPPPVKAAVVVGDLDADGLSDVVELGLPVRELIDLGRVAVDADDDGQRLELTGRRGTDGAVLWQTRLEPHEPRRSAVLPTRLRQGAGALVLSGAVDDDLLDTTNAQYAGTGTLAATKVEPSGAYGTAVDASGRVVWSLRVDQGLNGFAVVEQPGPSLAAHARVDGEKVTLLGPGQIVDGPALDVLLAVTTRVQAGPAGVARTRLLAVDGADGRLVDLASLTTAGGPTAARLLEADLDRDGLQDVVVRESGFLQGLALLSSRTGRTLWTQPAVRSDRFWEARPLGDLTGDGVTDLAFVDDAVYIDYDLVNEQVTLLDGATGAVLQRAAQDVVLAEDRDGDGRGELLFGDVTGEDLRLTVVDARGRVLRQAVPGRRGGASPAGDLDDDGLTDLLVGALGPDGPPPYRVSGQTLRATPTGRPWVPLQVSLDGRGDDVLVVQEDEGRLVVEALDGRTGSPLWRTVRGLPEGAAGLVPNGVRTGDTTGDGVPEVLVGAYFLTGDVLTSTVLDGATGRVLLTER